MVNAPMRKTRPSSQRLRLVCALCGALTTTSAYANSRFPAAQQVVIGPGNRSDVIALRVTFGLVLSTDGGRTFHWLCERAMYAPYMPVSDYDPAIEVSSRGEVFYGYERGVRITSDACSVRGVPDLDARTMQDLTSTPSGDTVFAIEATATSEAVLSRIDVATLRVDRVETGLRSEYFDTLEVAPSNEQRVYLSGRTGVDLHPVLYRSDDGGRHFEPLSTGAAADALWLSGIDARNPDVVYLRASRGLGTELRRSRDGGRSFERVASTPDPMLGFALSDDGRSIWVGSIASGLQRSDDGGDSFRSVNALPIYCLRYHAGVLWACSDWDTQPFALGRSNDGGEHFEAVLQFTNRTQFPGPPRCASPTEPFMECVERWPMLRELFANPFGQPLRDGGFRDVTSARDATSVVMPTPPNCGCRAARRGNTATWWCFTLVAMMLRRRARRGVDPTTQGPHCVGDRATEDRTRDEV